MRRLVVQSGQPIGEPRVAAIGHHHQVGGQLIPTPAGLEAGRAGPEPHPGDARPPGPPAKQAGDVDSLTDPHVGERGDAAADDRVDQVAAGGEQQEITGEPDVPTVRAHPRDILGRVHRNRAGPHQLAGQAREEPLYNSAAASQQDVGVPALRQPLTRGRGLGEVVALQQRDVVEMVGQHAGRQHPGQAASDGHSVAATTDSEAIRRVDGISRVHTILLPRSEPGLEEEY